MIWLAIAISTAIIILALAIGELANRIELLADHQEKMGQLLIIVHKEQSEVDK